MIKRLSVFWTSITMTFKELNSNKVRATLSLIGVSFGIFCIISVLATVQSLERNIKDGLKDLGSNTVYIQKWPWGGGDDYPWWKYAKRPDPDYDELKPVKDRSQYAEAVSFILFNSSNVEYKDGVLQNVNWYGVTEEYNQIQEVKILFGRYISSSEFQSGSNVVVMGYDNAEKLFGTPERAIGRTIDLAGRKANVIGVMKKKGQSLMGGWDFDNIIIVPVNYCRQVVNERTAGRFIMVKGREGIAVQDLKDELKGVMRSVRKLSPTADDNFALNDITSGSSQLESLFSSLNIGGFVIGGFSLIVGLFGIANIMFVTVKERTAQIGLKKAIGAKRSTILTEFLVESSVLCIVGGMFGLLLVFLVTKVLTAVLSFPISVSLGIVGLAVGISLLVGLLAGIIPAWSAARMDPVVAIRSK
ncbi:MAG: ABC transporter permease [Chitinophagaceae bacterium]